MGKNKNKKKRRKRARDGDEPHHPTRSSSGGNGGDDTKLPTPTSAASSAPALSEGAAVTAPPASNPSLCTSSGTAPPSGGGEGAAGSSSSWSWSKAFAAASAVQPCDLDDDFLRRTAGAAPPPSSGGGGLAAIAEMAEASASGKKGGQTGDGAADRKAPPPAEPLDGTNGVKVDSSQKERKRRTKKKKKKRENRATEEEEEDETRAREESAGSKKRKRQRPPDSDSDKGVPPSDGDADGSDDDNETGQQTPALQQALEGRMVPHPSSPHQIMVLVDRKSDTVYSGIERTESGDLIQVGRLVNGEVILDHVQEGCEAEAEEGQPRGGGGLSSSTRSTEPSFPYPTEPDDHCESPAESYDDIVPLLRQICNGIGGGGGDTATCRKKAASELVIYDPYYCDGSVVENLDRLGFPNTYNKKEDCYAVWRSSSPSEKAYPQYDVFLTNPPYSADHIERLMEHVTSARVGARPWFLLMPQWVHKKDYYVRALERAGCAPFYLVPKKRYVYVPPKNFRSKRVSDVHKKSSPFVSMWYVWGGTAERTVALWDWYVRWNRENGGGRCDVARSRSALRDLRRKKR